MRAIRTKMTIPPVMDDVAAMMKFIETQEAVKPGPVGAHGYCMSGPYALAAAARYPDRVAAAASFYGTWLVSDAVESPHLTLRKANGELYIACAEHDELAPLPMVAELKLLFSASGSRASSKSIRASTTASVFPTANSTKSTPPSATGNGSSRCIGGGWVAGDTNTRVCPQRLNYTTV